MGYAVAAFLRRAADGGERKEVVRKPVGVMLAAVVLGLMALIGIVISAGSILVTLVMHNPAIPAVPGIKAIMAGTTAVMLGFFLFCAWTVVGLFRMRPWARYAILAIGGVEFFFTALMCGVMILMRNMPLPVPPTGPSPVSVQGVFLGMGVFYGLLSLIGVWWLVYFNVPAVRPAFSQSPALPVETGWAAPGVMAGQPQAFAQTEGTPGWRIVIIVWACLMLLSILYVPMLFLMHVPLFMFGMVMRGSGATALMLVLFGAQFVLGAGLLRKWKPAWYLGMAWQAYTVAVFLSFLVPAVRMRFMAYEHELMREWAVSNHSGNMAMDMGPFVELGMILGVGLVVVCTIALVKRRADYLHAG